MQPDPRFVNQPPSFWANVRSISQQIGYTERSQRAKNGGKKLSGRIRVPTIVEMTQAMEILGLQSSHIVSGDKPTVLGENLFSYFEHRADVLNNYARPRLMDRRKAATLFHSLRKKLKPSCPIPMNKQKGDKRTEAYFTGIINMLIEAHADGLPCDYDPRKLTTVTRNGAPLRTLARRVDGAFPSDVNPIAVWEIKEYYYTTTFGSRVADGVYESLLDGMELQELREHEQIDVKHYLMVDDRYTWWDCGRSYLCRIVDMLHMGYLDEVLIGYEVVERLPLVVEHWVELEHARRSEG